MRQEEYDTWHTQMEVQAALNQQWREEALKKRHQDKEEHDAWMLHLVFSQLEWDDPVYKVLAKTWSNVVLIIKYMGRSALKHYGMLLTVEENNCLTHALNGNGRFVYEWSTRKEQLAHTCQLAQLTNILIHAHGKRSNLKLYLLPKQSIVA